MLYHTRERVCKNVGTFETVRVQERDADMNVLL